MRSNQSPEGALVPQIDLAELDPSGEVRTLAEDAGALDPDGATRRDLVRRRVVGVGGMTAGSALFGLLSPLDAYAAATAN